MFNDALLAIIHHFFAFGLLACLAAEWGLLLCNPERSVVQRLALVDTGYGLAALGSLGAGLARLTWGIKPAAYYINNPLFWVKMGAWGIVGAISVIPTLQYLKWRKAEALPSIEDFAAMRKWVVLELIFFIAIPTFAALMARGYGYSL